MTYRVPPRQVGLAPRAPRWHLVRWLGYWWRHSCSWSPYRTRAKQRRFERRLLEGKRKIGRMLGVYHDGRSIVEAAGVTAEEAVEGWRLLVKGLPPDND